MKEEVSRILKLVAEGKLSPEDAAELIDAFGGTQAHADAEPQAAADDAQAAGGAAKADASKDPIKGFFEAVETFGRDLTKNVDWQELSAQVKQNAQKGADALRKATEDLKLGNFSLWGVQEVREFSLPLNVEEGRTLRIENPGGSVSVMAGQNENVVYVKAKVRAATLEEAQKKAQEFSVVVEESDHVVQIVQPRVASISVDLVVHLTTGCPVEIVTESGDLSVSDTGMSAKVTSHSGDVSLDGLKGLVEAKVQSGDLKISDCESPSLSLDSHSGNVSIAHVDGSINARVASGDVSVSDWAGKTLSVESVSGDVSIDLPRPIAGTISIRTVNGDAAIGVADGGDCRVSLSTLRGVVRNSVPLADEARTESNVTGRLGAGTHTFDVSGINGNITLKLRDSANGPTSEAAAAAQ